MADILYLSKDDIYKKVIDLALKNFDVNIIQDSSLKNADSYDLVIVDSDILESSQDIISKLTSLNKPVILLKNIINGEDLKLDHNFTIVDKPFEDSIFIKEINKLCELKIKNGEGKMAEEKNNKVDLNDEDILELTDVVEETAENVSDVLSTDEAKKEETKQAEPALDEFNLDDLDNLDDSDSDDGLKSDEVGDLFEENGKSVDSEEKKAEAEFDIVDEKVDKTEEDLSMSAEPEDKSIEEAEEVNLDDTPESIEITKETEEGIGEEVEEVASDVATEIEEDKDTQPVEEEIQIPVDKETKELAKEIDQEDIEEKKEVIEKPVIKSSDSVVDMNEVEKKLLQASQKIIEAIEEATVEIAQGIAKVTPKIIEEVSKEIIPKIAQKIISEELNRKKED